MTAAGAGSAKPTIVLVHGAFAESASWNGVIPPLAAAGYRVIAAANPLRSVSTDAASVASVIDSIGGPVLLVAHSYGGTVISVAAAGRDEVIGLVYVAGFAPAIGESTADLTGRYPGSTLAETVVRVPLPGGGVDVFIDRDAFHEQFCQDVPADVAALMAATQRPMTQAALSDRATAAAWTDVPSFFVIPTADRSIPPDAQRFMAERAGSRRTVEVQDASHAVAESQPAVVADVVLDAANALAPSVRHDRVSR
jgi:pimeloyl-ACP methyl ester carboxylesterase